MKRNFTAAFVCGWIGALLLLSPAAAEDMEFRDGKWVPVARPAEGSEDGHLALVRKFVEDKQGRQAVASAEKFLKTYGDSSHREEAMLLAGRGELLREHYYQAFEWFEKQLAEFPSGRYYEWALTREFEVAEAFLAGKKRIVAKMFYMPAEDDGLEILLRIAEHAPGTPLALKAMLRIADHHYGKNRFPEAVEAYDRFVELFPKSEQAEYAALQAARATHAQFKGPEFDDTPLLEARQRYQAFQERYPQAARTADVPAILAGIADARANKLYVTGDFYKRTGRPQSAAYYYKLIQKDYPQTDWASRAEQALTLLGQGSPAPAAEGRGEETPAETKAKGEATP